MTPRIVVIHGSASGSGPGTIDYLCKPDTGKSAHLVIDRDGTITQLVAFDIPAWHAGESTWKGESNVNAFSIGIELINWGKLVRGLDGEYLNWTNRAVPFDEVVLAFGKDQAGGAWHNWPEPQIKALQAVLVDILRNYKSIKGVDSIVGHYDVSPGRKPDPGKALPMGRVREAVAMRLFPAVPESPALKPGTSGDPEPPAKIRELLVDSRIMTSDELEEWWVTPNPFVSRGKPPKDMPLSWLLVNLGAIALFLGKGAKG